MKWLEVDKFFHRIRSKTTLPTRSFTLTLVYSSVLNPISTIKEDMFKSEKTFFLLPYCIMVIQSFDSIDQWPNISRSSNMSRYMIYVTQKYINIWTIHLTSINIF